MAQYNRDLEDNEIYRCYVDELQRRPEPNGTIFQSRTCPYCTQMLEVWEGIDDIDDDDTDVDMDNLWSVRLEICNYCSHWVFQRVTDYTYPRDGGWGARFDGCSSVLGEFSETMPPECSSELAVALRRQPSIYHSISPTNFERFVADVFRANYSHTDVFHVGRSADDGIDVVFVAAEEERWLIQVKRRESPFASEGVATIRSLLGTMVVNDALKGVVVSTADHFTANAIETANRAAARGYEIDLVDRGKLDKMLDRMLPTRGWDAAITYIQKQRLDGVWVDTGRTRFPNFCRLSPHDSADMHASVEQLRELAGSHTGLAQLDIVRRRQVPTTQLSFFSPKQIVVTNDVKPSPES